MPSRFYDVVVLGRSLGALTAAVLLSRRDFRVLLAGQGQRPQTYRYEGRLLARRTFALLSGSSPAFRRMLEELAQIPQFRRRTQHLDPMFTLLCDGRRIEVPPDMDLFAREVDREFAEVRQLVDELYTTVAHVNAGADAAFEREGVWPPATLWERLETGRVAYAMPFARGDKGHDLLGKFPRGHAFRELVTVPVEFATHLSQSSQSSQSAAELPALALARLHGAWTRGISALGQSRLHGVWLDGADDPLGAGAVISDQSGEALAELSGGEGVTRSARRDWPKIGTAAGRFVTSLVVRRELLPAPLGKIAFVLPKSEGRRDPRRPIVRLELLDPLEFPEPHPKAAEELLLVAEMLLPARGALTLLEAREAVLSSLREALPFLDEHLICVDSPHDGLPLYDFESGARREVERVRLTRAAATPEPMERQISIDRAGYLDLSGEPLRGPIPGTYLVGKTVLPALGQEGELLAGASVARIITRKDRARQRMRHQMWSRAETQ